MHYLTSHPDARVRLDGHVDDHYSAAYGLVLSEKLAKVVKMYLIEHGVTNRIKTRSYGNGRPACLERNEECRRKNNRVHVLVIGLREIPDPTPVAMSLESHGSAPRASETAPAFEFPTVYLQRNRFQLGKKARASLTPLVAHLKSHPDLQIRLIVRVDERHRSAYGFTSSEKRVEAVKKLLQEHGVKNAIKMQGVGKDRPVCFEHNENCFRISNQVRVAGLGE